MLGCVYVYWYWYCRPVKAKGDVLFLSVVSLGIFAIRDSSKYADLFEAPLAGSISVLPINWWRGDVRN